MLPLLNKYKGNERVLITLVPYLKSRKNVRKKILGKDFPPEAKNAPNKRTGTREKGSLVKQTRNEIPATTTVQVYAIALFERAVTQSHGMNDSFLSLCHTYERSDHAWKLFRKAFGTCHALYTVFIERIAHEQKPHFFWSLGPLFSVILFFFF